MWPSVLSEKEKTYWVLRNQDNPAFAGSPVLWWITASNRDDGYPS